MSKYGDLAVFLFQIVNQAIFFYLVFVLFLLFDPFFIVFIVVKEGTGPP